MAFKIAQEKFEGPLELLLELIEGEKLVISEISLARVTDDYIKYVKALERIDPEALAEFLVIAAQLMLLKSRTLLPDLKLSEEEEVSAEDLEKRLAEYQKMREFAKKIKEFGALNRHIFTREAYLGMEAIFYPPPGLTLDSFKNSFFAFLAALPKLEKLAEDKIRRIISLEERIKDIQKFLQDKVEQAFSAIIRGSKEKVDVIVSFLAILEMSKQKFISLEQDTQFGEIVIKKQP